MLLRTWMCKSLEDTALTMLSTGLGGLEHVPSVGQGCGDLRVTTEV